METNWRGSGHESLQGAIPAIAWKGRERERERERAKNPENLSGEMCHLRESNMAPSK